MQECPTVEKHPSSAVKWRHEETKPVDSQYKSSRFVLKDLPRFAPSRLWSFGFDGGMKEKPTGSGLSATRRGCGDLRRGDPRLCAADGLGSHEPRHPGAPATERRDGARRRTATELHGVFLGGTGVESRKDIEHVFVIQI